MTADPTHLVHAYADAVCHNDADAWVATWADDGVWDMGGAQIEGREELGSVWKSAMAGFEQVIQVVYNGTVQVDEGTGAGSGRWYIGEFLDPVDGPSQMLLAYYDDDYTRSEGAWLFSRRKLVRLYSGPPDLSSGFAGPPAASPSP
jgi:hypothetical protein